MKRKRVLLLCVKRYRKLNDLTETIRYKEFKNKI